MKRLMISMLLLSAMCGAAQAASFTGTPIADWQFNGAGWLLDSANGYHLTNWGATQNAGQTTAVFNGAAIVGTGNAGSGPVDLTPYRQVRVSWRMLVLMETSGVVWEHGYTTITPGDLAAVVNEHSYYSGGSGTPGIGIAALNNTDHDQLPHAVDSVTWETFEIEYDLDAAVVADVVRVWRNGTELPDTSCLWINDHLPGEGYTFLNTEFFIGGRMWSALFTGEVDYVTIEVIPEPATMALLGFGGVMVLVRRRRR